jgi:hypothetical protein
MSRPSFSAAVVWLTFLTLSTAATTTTASSLTSTTTSTTTTYPLIPHHIQRARRILEEPDYYDATWEPPRHRRDAAQQVGALYQGYGTHYIDLWCGTPPQRQTVIVDTGSSVTAFPCSGCQADCGAPDYHIDAYFIEANSSTFTKTTCGDTCEKGRCSAMNDPDADCVFGMSYQEGSSWTAYEAKDVCYVGGPHSSPLLLSADKDEEAVSPTEDIDPKHANAFGFELAFGCQTHVTGLFKTQLADGIMGMENSKEAFWYQMYNAGKLDGVKQFSICFARQPTAEREGTEAGALTLGGVDDRLDLTDMVHSKTISMNAGFFTVNVRKVHVREGIGGESARSANPDAKIITMDLTPKELNRGDVIVDSGTTDTYWTSHMASLFQDAFSKMTGGRQYNNTAIEVTNEELASFPTVLFQLVGDETINGALPPGTIGLAGDIDPEHPLDVLLAFPPSHLFEWDESKDKYVGRFYLTESSGSVLGANSMMGHNVLFDSDNGRIGWAESDCDYTQLLTKNGYNTNDFLEINDNDDENNNVDPIDITEKETEVTEEVIEEEEEIIEEIEEEEAETEPETTEQQIDQEEEKHVEDEEHIEEVEETETEPEENTKQQPGSTDKKKQSKPSGGGDDHDHDKQSPSDDIKKKMSGAVDACNGLTCRGGVLGTLLAFFVACFCLRRYCCGGGSSRNTKPLYHRAEVEMANGSTFSSYKDDFDDDDAEFGVLS